MKSYITNLLPEHLYLLVGVFVTKDQLNDLPSKQTISEIFARITALPSPRHHEMKFLHQETATAIALRHLSKSKPLVVDTSIPVDEISQNIIAILRQQLGAFDDMMRDGYLEGSADAPLLIWDAQMFICGLLDLLSQLASALPTRAGIVDGAKALALHLIRSSDNRAFRYKAVSAPEWQQQQQQQGAILSIGETVRSHHLLHAGHRRAGVLRHHDQLGSRD